jgi:hypothetical protein
MRLGTITKEAIINNIMDKELNTGLPNQKQIDRAVPAILKDGTNPFFVRVLRKRIKYRCSL